MNVGPWSYIYHLVPLCMYIELYVCMYVATVYIASYVAMHFALKETQL